VSHGVFSQQSAQICKSKEEQARSQRIYVKDKVQAQSRRETSGCFLVNEGILEKIVDTDSKDRPRLSDAR
jgi:hypothetical protein